MATVIEHILSNDTNEQSYSVYLIVYVPNEKH